LGDSKWQSRLRPVTFFSLSATPCVELRWALDSNHPNCFPGMLQPSSWIPLFLVDKMCSVFLFVCTVAG
jgi:hypothetical protein